MGDAWKVREALLRRAQVRDAGAISALIGRAVRETNWRDYTPASIETVARTFHPGHVVEIISTRTVFVAQIEDRLAATAGLDGSTVKSVFVLPDYQGRGLGRLLMQRIEKTAVDRCVTILRVPSSLTAVPFYRRLGYAAVPNAPSRDGSTVLMEKSLRAEDGPSS